MPNLDINRIYDEMIHKINDTKKLILLSNLFSKKEK